MKQSLQNQLNNLQQRYRWVTPLFTNNMRVLLLVLFAALSGYLVLRINTLVNSEEAIASENTSAVIKKIDQDVISTFNELYVQDVNLDSNFEEDRENPF